MGIPIIKGVIDRRVLINFRVEPAVITRILPAPFRPKLHNGSAIAGICLIRLRAIRPRFLPSILGFGSENAAHRIAVEWNTDDGQREGVYIPRRDTSSLFNVIAGGRIFPGEHHRARFECRECDDVYEIKVRSADDRCCLHLKAHVASALPIGSGFGSMEEASRFFEGGAYGYSVSRRPQILQGLELRCKTWIVHPLDVETVQSSYFDDESLFPIGSVQFDCTLLMRNIEHEWHAHEPICCGAAADLPISRQ